MSGLCDAFRNEASSNLVQLCEVQSCGWNSRASSRSGGIGVGSLLAPATCMRNEFLSFLDSASAAPLAAPGMCCALRIKLCFAVNRNRLRINCMALSHLLVPLFTMATTAALSHLHLTALSCHWPPHKATLSTIGRSSCIVICSPLQESGHSSWNHSPRDEKDHNPTILMHQM